MPLVERYDTPAGIEDLERGSPTDLEFRARWNEVVGNIVTPPPFEPPPDGKSGREPTPSPPEEPPVDETVWIDPLTEDAEVIAARSLSWIAFPRMVLPARWRDDRERAFADAELDREFDQNEYFEWHTTRRADGTIVKVVFVTETPEYWRTLAETSDATRKRLVELYQELVCPDVQEADLFKERTTEDGVSESYYDERNRWNNGDGIVHFLNGANNLALAVGLLARNGALRQRPVDAYADTEANAPTSVDNYIPRDVNALVRNGHRVAVADPVGLYIDGWDDTGWTKPDGSPVGDYWRITRGRPGLALRVEYEVPEDVAEREGFVVGDIRIGGRPITYGGQIAEHMTAALPVLVCKGRS